MGAYWNHGSAKGALFLQESLTAIIRARTWEGTLIPCFFRVHVEFDWEYKRMSTSAIAGVPAGDRETNVMTVWPSVSTFGLGRILGQLYSIRLGFYVFKIGNLLALLTCPIGAVMYLLRVAPFIGTRYVITDERIVVKRGLSGVDERSVNLDRFNDVQIDVRPGQAWFVAGDLIFRMGDTETFRLEAVPNPESFRQTCLKSQRAYVGVKAAIK